MKQVLIQSGRAVVREMPSPGCGENEVLVRAAYSLISTGTETVTLRQSSEVPGGVWARRLKKVGEVARLVTERGPRAAAAVVRDRVAGPCVLTGYSLAGTVVRVGSKVSDLVPGQMVACAGASTAHHAEIVAVPRNLVVPVPDRLPLEDAAFVTLGAIALQGIRTAELRLGEVVCVVGLGLIGQITVALARASGTRVWGIDRSPARVERAASMGLEEGFVADRDDVERRIDHLTGARGVDAVLLTAGTPSSEPIRQAVRIVRRRGRVVVVGAVGMEIDRGPLYMKEAEVRISRSYGPGRYDPAYEDRGIDYPFDYVRWTENRNMEEFLRLTATGAVPVGDLVGKSFPVGEADAAYRSLSEGPDDERPLAVLLEYPGDESDTATIETTRVEVAPPPRRDTGLGVALVGPGGFANAVHLPNLAELRSAANLRAVVGRTGNAAREQARRWSASYASTELDEVLGDAEIDVVLISTRHDLHAEQAVRALEAGKAVFLEKPAAIDRSSLERLDRAVRESGRPVTVGFNRRFAPDVLALEALLRDRRGPMVIDYRVNAGKLPPDHWALGPEGGGRLIGEACHMIDLLGHLVGRPRVGHRLQVLAPPPGRPDLPLGDNLAVAARYSDGSLTTLTYTSLGHAGAGKERLEAHWDGRTAVVDDFKRLEVHGVAGPETTRPNPDKGHLEMLRRFVEHVSGRGDAPIPWEQILDVTRFTLDLDDEARGAETPSQREG